MEHSDIWNMPHVVTCDNLLYTHQFYSSDTVILQSVIRFSWWRSTHKITFVFYRVKKSSKKQCDKSKHHKIDFKKILYLESYCMGVLDTDCVVLVLILHRGNNWICNVLKNISIKHKCKFVPNLTSYFHDYLNVHKDMGLMEYTFSTLLENDIAFR